MILIYGRGVTCAVEMCIHKDMTYMCIVICDHTGTLWWERYARCAMVGYGRG